MIEGVLLELEPVYQSQIHVMQLRQTGLVKLASPYTFFIFCRYLYIKNVVA